MIRRLSIIGAVLVLLASACSPQAAAPTLNSQDIQQTAEAAAFTVVAQTQEAQPTNTPLPPTEAATITPLPTLTAPPTSTIDPSLPTAIGLPTIAITSALTSVPTAVPVVDSSGSTADACNKPLTEWKGPTANFSIRNETKPQGDIVLSLYVITPTGECGYLTDLSQGPAGSYSAGAFVNGKQNFKVFGSFQIQEGNWKITVRNDKIIAMGSCYPNC
jgi:hypothetical protein